MDQNEFDDLFHLNIEEYFIEAKELRSGIFWVITDDSDIEEWKLLVFDIFCDTGGNITKDPEIPVNAKSETTYNHKKLWETEVKNNPFHKPYNKREYDYHPRGRVDISNNKATIYLNPHINKPNIIKEIKSEFGLSTHNISAVRVFNDNSDHYKCFIDNGQKR